MRALLLFVLLTLSACHSDSPPEQAQTPGPTGTPVPYVGERLAATGTLAAYGGVALTIYLPSGWLDFWHPAVGPVLVLMVDGVTPFTAADGSAWEIFHEPNFARITMRSPAGSITWRITAVDGPG